MRGDFFAKVQQIKGEANLPTESVVFLDVENVAKLVGEQKPRWDELPCITPPWQVTWAEYDSRTLKLFPAARVGMLAMKLEVTDEMRFGLHESVERFPDNIRHLVKSSPTGSIVVILQAYLYDGKRVMNQVKQLALRLDSKGKYGLMANYSATGDVDLEWLDIDAGFFVFIAAPVMEAFALLNCKNVHSVDNAPPPKVRKARERKGEPIITYKTLAIQPMKAVGKSGKAAQTGIKQSFHIRRGHYRTYTKEKPLFGKHSGTFYVEQYAAGNRSVGEVKKDYRIDVAN